MRLSLSLSPLTRTHTISLSPRAPQVLVLSSRGITYRYRHLLDDLRVLLPHSKRENKMDSKDTLPILNEIAEIRSCNNVLYLETRKKRDLYMWVAKSPFGPSAKFLVQNVHTMDELKLTGNCLMGSRPLLSFDRAFDTEPHYALLKELFTQVFGTPKGHPKSKPFFDHVFHFGILDNRIWFRNYQITSSAPNVAMSAAAAHAAVARETAGEAPKKDRAGVGAPDADLVLLEIGPRFTMNPVRIFNGSFQGATLWENPGYISPSAARRAAKKAQADAHVAKKNEAKRLSERKSEITKGVDGHLDPLEGDNVFKAELGDRVVGKEAEVDLDNDDDDDDLDEEMDEDELEEIEADMDDFIDSDDEDMDGLDADEAESDDEEEEE